MKDAGQIAGDRFHSRRDLMDQQHAKHKAEFETKERAPVKENGDYIDCHHIPRVAVRGINEIVL